MLFSYVYRLQKWGLNTYLYAPKDDYKHRMFWREMYSVEEAGNCLFFPSLFPIGTCMNELVIAVHACVCLITVAFSKGEWRPVLNNLQMYLVELWYKCGFISFN